MPDAHELWIGLGASVGTVVLMCAAAYLVFGRSPPSEPITPERERLDRLEKLQRAVTDALYSTREARIWTSEDFSDLDAVRAMRERLGFACDSLVSAQRETTEWLRVAVAKEQGNV